MEKDLRFFLFRFQVEVEVEVSENQNFHFFHQSAFFVIKKFEFFYVNVLTADHPLFLLLVVVVFGIFQNL